MCLYPQDPFPPPSHIELELSTHKLRPKEKCRPQTKINLGTWVPDSVLENHLPLDAQSRENSIQDLGGPSRGAVPQNRQYNNHTPSPTWKGAATLNLVSCSNFYFGAK